MLCRLLLDLAKLWLWFQRQGEDSNGASVQPLHDDPKSNHVWRHRKKVNNCENLQFIFSCCISRYNGNYLCINNLYQEQQNVRVDLALLVAAWKQLDV